MGSSCMDASNPFVKGYVIPDDLSSKKSNLKTVRTISDMQSCPGTDEHSNTWDNMYTYLIVGLSTVAAGLLACLLCWIWCRKSIQPRKDAGTAGDIQDSSERASDVVSRHTHRGIWSNLYHQDGYPTNT